MCTLPIGELHTYWSSQRVENWIITEYRPMAESWNVYFVCQELIVIMYFVAWYFWQSNKINFATVISFILLAIMDMAMYFYNYKLGGFGVVYFWFIGFWVVAYNWNLIKKAWT